MLRSLSSAARGMFLGTVALLRMTSCKHTILEPPKPRRGPDPLELLPYDVQLARAQQVTAVDLFRLYAHHHDGQDPPDMLFRYKLLHVTGVFAGVSRLVPGTDYIELASAENEGFTYALVAPGDGLDVASLRVGETVKILCHGAGHVAGSPMLKDCHGE